MTKNRARFKTASRPPKSAAREKNEETRNSGDFLVVTIGASAGGIEAFGELMDSLPTDTGMAFVLIQHLDPTHESILTELVSRRTKMVVTEVKNNMPLERDHVYVIPPNTTMSATDHVLKLRPREGGRLHMPIDHFMRTLAEDLGNRVIGVILSGSGTDGTLGMAEIQAQGGVTFAQDESSAQYDGMPRSVVAAGYADYILPPKAIARELARIAHHPYIEQPVSSDSKLLPSDNSGLEKIYHMLRRSTVVDFTHYRQTTILRQIQRRMVVHKIDKLTDYVRYLQVHPREINALYQDMLINVTSFFRNPSVFEAMKSEVFAKILQNCPKDPPLRVWTPGCASGEETYSVAMALLEFLGDRATEVPIQLFGTDVSETSIAKARSGLYPENVQGDISPERLRRFFTRTDGGYCISKSIRDMCIFAQHNVLSDPPFSQMDLICCRNLLIYLEPILQSKVISLFHYAIRGSGFLMLGTSEGVGTVANLFAAEDRAFKIFAKKSLPGRQVVSFSLERQAERLQYGPTRLPAKHMEATWNHVDAQKEFDRRLLSQYSPAVAFVNEDLEVIHTRGDVSRYLKLAPGRVTLNILKMAREGLLFDLRNALARAKKAKITVRKQNVQIKNGNGNGHGKPAESTRLINFDVVPIHLGSLKEFFFMILFQDVPEKVRISPRGGREQKRDASHIAKIEQELAATKEYLQSVIENQEATNEELQSANEEILSSNEELQSTNEELETAKEELQSTNEELSTVNDELRARNLEANNDLTNLFTSIGIPILTVGRDLTIRRLTPLAGKMMGILPTDVGRPLNQLNPAVPIPDFHQMVWQVISAARVAEKEFVDPKGMRWQLRIVPYRSTDNKIDGAVIVLLKVGGESAKVEGAKVQLLTD